MKLMLILIVLALLGLSQQSVDYNHDYSLQFLYYSKASYCESKNIQNWDCDACRFHPRMREVTVIDNFSYQSQMYLGFDPDTNLIVIAFRGSHNIRNWMSDLNFVKTKYPVCHNCEVHAGFYNSWLAISSKVVSAYKALKQAHPDAQLLITGHSLGAAIANLCALDFAQNNYKVDFLYVYGCPRVGNKDFAKYAGTVLDYQFQVIHYKDPVPHLPSLIQFFKRNPTEVWYDNKHSTTEYKVCPSQPGDEDKHCSDKYDIFVNVDDHLNYLGYYTGCTDQESNSKLSSSEQFVVYDDKRYLDIDEPRIQ